MKHLIKTSVALCVLSSPYIHAQDVEAEGDIVVAAVMVMAVLIDKSAVCVPVQNISVMFA